MTKQKILIVDDIEANLISLERVLAGLNVQVVRASSGNDALIAILNHDFALAIIDVQMPVMDGYELAEYIRSEKRTESLPVIFLSAVYSDEYHVFKGYESGAVDFMTKPFNPYYLVRKVEIFLELARQKELLREKLEIEHSKNYLESVVGAISDSLIVLDLNGNITNTNKTACTMLGYSQEELLRCQINQLFPGDFFPGWLTLMASCDDGCTPGKETVILGKNGSGIPVIISGSMMRNGNGNVTGSVIIAYDISERKKFEAGLIEARKKSEEISSLKSHFLRSMSHEIRTPLTGISGYTEMLLGMVTDEEQKELLGKILISGERLGHTLRSILDFSKLESGAALPSMEQVDLSEEVKKTAGFYSSLAAEKGLIFNSVTDAHITTATVDRELFKQALNHLLDNAFKFTVSGSVTIVVENRLFNGVMVIDVKVKDTGIGISPENKNKIWEEFRQESEGLNRRYEGAGLGLTIARKFIERMGGTIDFTSSSGAGTTFVLTLPVSTGGGIVTPPEKSNKTEADLPVAATSAMKPKVLYVEDEKLNRDLVNMFLRDIVELDLAATGETGLEMAIQNRYDGFLLDINLGPGINGVEVAKKLREIDHYREIPVVALTALALNGDKESFLAQGCSHYMSKPFSKNGIRSFVQEIFRIGPSSI